MNYSKIAEDLFDVVDPSKFLSPDRIETLRNLSPTKLASLHAMSEGEEVEESVPSIYKMAYEFGRDKFVKEAENLAIWKGIREYKRLSSK